MYVKSRYTYHAITYITHIHTRGEEKAGCQRWKSSIYFLMVQNHFGCLNFENRGCSISCLRWGGFFSSAMAWRISEGTGPHGAPVLVGG